MGFAYKPVRFDDLDAINSIDGVSGITTSYEEIAHALANNLPEGLILLDGFPTANFSTFVDHLIQVSSDIITIDVSRFYRSSEDIQGLLKPYLPQDREIDPELIFGRLFDQSFQPFLDLKQVSSFLNNLVEGQIVILFGLGSACELFRPLSEAILYIDVTPKDTAWRVYDGRYQCLGNPNEQNLDTVIRQTYFIDV